MLKRIWNDPVWSKVIAAGILALLATIWAGVHFDWWPTLLSAYRVPLWLLVLLIALFFLSLILALRKQHRFGEARKPPLSQPVPQIRILLKNAAMHMDIHNLLAQNPANIQRVVIVQYSGRNVKDIVDEIWVKTSADIDLYLKDPAEAINKHQEKRITEMLEKFSNELDTRARGGGVLEIFTYQAPGSVRAVLIDGRRLYIGAYFYKVVPVSAPELDTRGGEMPLLVIPSDHPDFRVLSNEVLDMVDNWKKNGKAASIQIVRKTKA